MKKARPFLANNRSRRFELAVMVAVLCVLLGFALISLNRMMALTERAIFEQDLGSMERALGLQVLKSVVHNKQQMHRLIGSNPLDYLQQPPANAHGAVTSFDRVPDPRPGWYFDENKDVLIYVVEDSYGVQTTFGPPPQFRFAVRPVYTDRDGDHQFTPGIDRLEAVHLACVKKFTWFNKKYF